MRNLTNEARIFLPALIEEVGNMVEFTAGMTVDEFLSDKKTRYAFRLSLTNASEAAGNIFRMDPRAPEKFPEIPFKQLNDTRNRIIHKYWKIDESIMYATATKNIAALDKVIRKVFEDDINLLKKVSHKSVLDIISSIHGDDLTPEDVKAAIDEVMKPQMEDQKKNSKYHGPENS